MKVSWVPSSYLLKGGRIGLSHSPGCRETSAERDTVFLQHIGITHVLCLQEEHELQWSYPPQTFRQRAFLMQEHGITFFQEPIVDYEPPEHQQMERLCSLLDSILEKQGAVLIHCMAGLGRSGTVLAGYFVSQGMHYSDAILLTRWLRPGAIQSQTQEDFLQSFHTHRAKK